MLSVLPFPGWVSFESYFSWIFSSFSVLEILSRIFFGVLIWQILCSKCSEAFLFHCCFFFHAFLRFSHLIAIFLYFFSGFLVWFVFRFAHVLLFSMFFQVFSCILFGFFRFSHLKFFCMFFFRFSNVICFQVCSCLVIFPCFFQVFSCILLVFFRFSHLMFFCMIFQIFSRVFLPIIAPFNVPTLVRNHWDTVQIHSETYKMTLVLSFGSTLILVMLYS